MKSDNVDRLDLHRLVRRRMEQLVGADQALRQALVVVMAQVQEATPQLRIARASMPIEYNDTEEFRGNYLGVGEKLVMALPAGTRTPPFATYTWDLGSHVVSVTAVCSDRERFGTVIGAVDELVRGIRVVDDLTIGETATVLRIDPA